MGLSEFRWVHPGGLLGPGEGRQSKTGKKGRVEAECTLGCPSKGTGRGATIYCIGHFLFGIWCHPHSKCMRVALIPHPDHFADEARRLKERVICPGPSSFGVEELRFQPKPMRWQSSQWFSSVTWCQLSVTPVLSVGGHFYTALASSSSLGEAGPGLYGDQWLAVAKCKKLYDTLLSDKNRIYNCISDERRQKQLCSQSTARKEQGETETVYE